MYSMLLIIHAFGNAEMLEEKKCIEKYLCIVEMHRESVQLSDLPVVESVERSVLIISTIE